MNAYKQWVRAVWFENGREVEGVAPGTWIKRGTVFWPKGTNAEPAYLDREEPNEKTWRSFKLVKVKFTSDKEEDCHEYDATTAEEEDDQDNRRGVKRKKEEDFLYEMDEADGALEQVLDDMSNDQTKDKDEPTFTSTPKSDRKLNKVLIRLSSSKKKQREDFRKSAEVRTAQEPKIRDMSGDGAQSLVGFDGDQEHSLINKSDMQSAINILIPPIPPCTPSRTNEPPTDDEDSDYEDIYVDEVDSQVEEVPDSSISKGKRPGKKLNKSSFPMATAKFQKRTLHLLVEIRSLLQRAVSQPGELVERGQQNSLYYAAKQFTHIHEFPDLNTEDKQLWIKRCQALGGKDPRDMVKNIMKRYLSKDLEQNLNMDGQRGAKTAFRGSSLHVLIVESVLEKFSSTVTEQRINEFIRNRLRNATKRQK